MAVWLLALALITPPHHARRKARHHVARHSRLQRVDISPARATQIQQALVHAGYLSEVSGHWDAASIAAMKKFQAAHDWQTRYVPDARALMALGLVRTGTEQVAENGIL